MCIKNFLCKYINRVKGSSDYIHVKLESLDIKMKRLIEQEIPYEVTVVVPRAEIREKYSNESKLVEREVLLNSITIVHAPRHSSASQRITAQMNTKLKTNVKS